ncbi:MAG: ABC transporter ATP-binding protein [Lachnospiraceae bacterium]
MPEQVIVDVNGLEKQYKKQKVVKGIDFQVKKGSICGLIGPNGAGKTTIMKMLGGMVIPTGGTISLFGAEKEDDLAKARSRMSFMIETPYMKMNLTAKQNLEKQRLQKGIPDKGRIDEVLELVGLHDVGNKRIKEYSLGMRQRLGIANAMLAKPEMMILDEPINGLDPEGIVEIRELLVKLNQEQDITIMISSHILSELAQMCTDYLFIQKGQIRKAITDEALQAECRSFLGIHTDNDALALAVLQEKLHTENFEVKEDGSIKLFDYLEEVKTVSKTLYDNGVIPLELFRGGENLEEYYMSMIGGNEDVEYSESPAVSVKKR